MSTEQLTKMRDAKGFVAALDQSGGSTPKALSLYGIDETQYSSEAEMFDLVHAMRTRIITSPAFNGDRILGAILFEMTMDRQIEGLPTATYLWQKKQIVPFLKVDKGLTDEINGVQVMNPMPELDALLVRARQAGIFGTKMRSVIKLASSDGINAVVKQQFEIAEEIIERGMVPIIEPEVDINSPQKMAAEEILKEELLQNLNILRPGQLVMLKLTLPEMDGFYQEMVSHPNVVRVVALSGGYSRAESNKRLSANPGVVASFSRALTEGLDANQSDEEFNQTLDTSIQSIYDASNT